MLGFVKNHGAQYIIVRYQKKSTKLFAINYAFQILPKIRHKGLIDDDDDDDNA